MVIDKINYDKKVCLWHEKISGNLLPADLKNQYQDIVIYKPKNSPYSEWCYIVINKYIPIPFLNSTTVIYKNPQGEVLTYYRNQPARQNGLYHMVIDAAEMAALADPEYGESGISKMLSELMINKNFKIHKQDC